MKLIVFCLFSIVAILAFPVAAAPGDPVDPVGVVSDSDSCGFVWGGRQVAPDGEGDFRPEEDPDYEWWLVDPVPDSGWSTTYPQGSFSHPILWILDALHGEGLSQPDEPDGH